MLESCQHNDFTLKVQETWWCNLEISGSDRYTSLNKICVKNNKRIIFYSKQYCKVMKLHKTSPKWIIYSSMGLEVGLSVVVGFLIGSWLDKWLGTEPWLLLVFGIAGIIAGYRSMFRMVKRIQSESETEKKNDSHSSSGKNV